VDAMGFLEDGIREDGTREDGTVKMAPGHPPQLPHSTQRRA